MDSRVIKQIPIYGYDNNFSYFVSDGRTREIAIVDPGDSEHVIREIETMGLLPRKILLTHSHFDHQGGVPDIVKAYGGIPVYIHKFGQGRVGIGDELIVYIEDKDVIKMGELEIEAIYTPGHIDDAVCYFVSDKNKHIDIPSLFTGDTLFVEGCGRADLENADVNELFKSLQKIKKLPDNTIVYPGHDYGSKPYSTIANEKSHNIYLQCETLKEFRSLRILK